MVSVPALAPITVPGTPAAEIEVDETLARRLILAQHADLADRPLALLASGWDNVVFRLGDDLLLRAPRRSVAAQLIRHEQRWLPHLAPTLPLPIPAPVRVGVPDGDYPWPWSITPWLEGVTADRDPPLPDQGAVLAGFFRALHVPAPAQAPRNPVRGVPLAARAEAVEQRLANLAARGAPIDLAALRTIWREGLDAPNDARPTWIHGDPHPLNVLVKEGRFSAVIDWGDLACGDRASDLAAVWMLLPHAASREDAVAGLPDVSPATWRRARGWAAFYVATLLDVGLEEGSVMAGIAAATLGRLVEDG